MDINSLLSRYPSGQHAMNKTANRMTPAQSPAANSAANGTGKFADILASAKSPATQLKEYLAMSDAERYQVAWLKKRGISKETFDAMPADQKQKLMEEMQRDMQREMKAKIEAAKAQNKQALNLLA